MPQLVLKRSRPIEAKREREVPLSLYYLPLLVGLPNAS